MAVNIQKLLKKKRLIRKLTGVSSSKFNDLLPYFENELYQKRVDSYVNSSKKRRKPVRNTNRGYLKTSSEKLFYILFYYHCYPAHEVLHNLFGYKKSSARNNVKKLAPILRKVIKKKPEYSRSRIVSSREFFSLFPEARHVFVKNVPRKRTVSKKITKKTEEQQKNIIKKRTRSKPVPFISKMQDEKIEMNAQSQKQVISSALEKPEKTHKKDIKKPQDPTPEFKQEDSNIVKELNVEQLRVNELKVSLPPSTFSGAPTQATGPVAQENLSSQPPTETKSQSSPSLLANSVVNKKDGSSDVGIAPQSAQMQHQGVSTQGSALDPHISKPEKIEQKMDYEEVTSIKLNQIKSEIKKQLGKPSGELSIIEFVNGIIKEAYYSRASDVHIEPQDKDSLVRLRIDGVLHDVITYPKNIHASVISRIKVQSGLRTDEHQAAQDGRFKAIIPDVGQIDVRVSIAPTYYGENTVMRVLTQHKELSLEEIGLSDEDVELVVDAVKKPYGMILSCGPTGSGKTTTLYAVIKLLNTRDVSIITIEDPIEYSIGGIDQIQVNNKTGLTFANGLRTLLRQDPDILMVGEIRDEETAAIAVNAALTGHLLLSTLHTNDAATSLPRLIDMGIEPFLLASTVNVIVGQRLVRRICDDCKIAYTFSMEELKAFKKVIDIEILKETTTFYRGKGCKTCKKSGYKGRVGIYEVLSMEDNIKQLVMSRASSDDIKYVAIKNGMTTMLEDGVKKATKGLTTLEEVFRVAKS